MPPLVNISTFKQLLYEFLLDICYCFLQRILCMCPEDRYLTIVFFSFSPQTQNTLNTMVYDCVGCVVMHLYMCQQEPFDFIFNSTRSKTSIIQTAYTQQSNWISKREILYDECGYNAKRNKKTKRPNINKRWKEETAKRHSHERIRKSAFSKLLFWFVGAAFAHSV